MDNSKTQKGLEKQSLDKKEGNNSLDIGETTILTTISILDKGNSDSKEEKIEKIDYSKIKVLFVDDKKSYQFFGETVLKEIGVIKNNIKIVDNGKSAIEEVLKNDFDIILMDRIMPIMGGDEALREIKKLKPYIPIISTTSLPEGIEHEDYDDYIKKPFVIKNFIEIFNKNIIKKPS